MGYCLRSGHALLVLLLGTAQRAAGSGNAAAARARLRALDEGGARHAFAWPLRTQGRYIVDQEGKRVRLACVNWYGAHLEQMVANGLNRQTVRGLARTIRELGFNCVRLPFSLDLVLGNRSKVPHAWQSLGANPELQHLSPLEVFDATVAALTDEGIMVILNNHVSTGRWCCGLNDGEGLWFTARYSEATWLEGLGRMAARYSHNPQVVGFDLRNEVRPSALGWPVWGGEGPEDWAAAAVRGAERVLGASPGLLVIVSGLYFSLFLCDVPTEPIHLHPVLRGRTVYTSHEYWWFNLHLMARSGVGAYFTTLAAWAVALQVLLISAWWMERRWRCCQGCASRLLRQASASRGGGATPAGGSSDRRRGRCSPWGCCSPWHEFCLAACFTLLTAVCLKLTSLFLQRCSFWDFIWSLSIFAATLICFVLSLVIWMWLAFKWTLRKYEPLLAGIELGVVPSASAAAHGGGQAFLARPPGVAPPEGCCPGHSSWSSSTATASSASSAVSAWSDGRPSSLERVGSAAHAPCGGRSAPFRRRLCLLARGARSMPCLLSAVVLATLGSLLYIYVEFGRFEVYAAELDVRWGFLLEGEGGEATLAPVWLGEFGTGSGSSLWWQHLLRYIRERDVDWAYWSINGQKRYTNVTEPFGLLSSDSHRVRSWWKLEDLWDLMRDAGLPVPSATTPLPSSS